jgi:hypothetical protein
MAAAIPLLGAAPQAFVSRAASARQTDHSQLPKHVTSWRRKPPRLLTMRLLSIRGRSVAAFPTATVR